MTKLEISCQLDIIERWQNLSPETQKFLLDYDSGLNFTKLLWAKQFYKEVAELSN
jgi:hypothetical protein